MEKIAVRNRSNSTVFYSIPEMGIRREYAPGETKRITKEEIEALTYRSGGLTLINRFLQVNDQKVLETMSVSVEPEYWLDDDGVKALLQNGSLDEFLDCLDFAPVGVIELIKKYAVSLPLNDVAKRKALKEKTQYDVDTILRNEAFANEEDETPAVETPKRRVQKDATTVARRATPEYKVVSTKKE